ncbi:putative esterase; SGNH hydrolase-type [Paratrimastix pyriformis]|uniref:Esterase n=1 Tax=Paratrimastix pyriformis TaxID=342808 RepID=A0ABQ8UEH1_9EUKA|nr:putative esterase; SGNH hydrolase-type [Paratrimastix pyriformis]
MRALLLLCLLTFVFGAIATETVLPSDSRITYSGRFDKSNPKMYTYDWSAVQYGISFIGHTLGIYLKDAGNQYDLIVDETQTLQFNATQDAGMAYYTLIRFEHAEQYHTVRLVKRTEALFGMVSFGGFEINHPDRSLSPLATPTDRPVPPREFKHRIEFLGDSLSCGYGNLGHWPCHFSADTEDAMQSFPYLTAVHFEAEPHLQCWSGKGVVRNYGDVNTTSADPFPTFYTRSGYHGLIAQVRRFHPDATVFLGSGVTYREPVDYVKRIAAKEGAHFIDLSNTLKTDYGCDYHPDLTADKRIAQRMIDGIAAVVGK